MAFCGGEIAGRGYLQQLSGARIAASSSIGREQTFDSADELGSADTEYPGYL